MLIAGPIASSGTTSAISARRTGNSAAQNTPAAKTATSSCQYWMSPLRISVPSVSITTPSPSSAAIQRPFRLTRSASVPSATPKKSRGSILATSTSATRPAESVSSKVKTPSTSMSSQRIIEVRIPATQIRRNCAFRSTDLRSALSDDAVLKDIGLGVYLPPPARSGCLCASPGSGIVSPPPPADPNRWPERGPRRCQSMLTRS